MRDVDKALADILEIRHQIAARTAFRGYGPIAMGLTGFLALVTASLQSVLPLTPTALIYCAEWLGVAVVCTLIVGVEMAGRSRRLHSGLADAMIHQAVEKFLPAGAASFFMPVLLFQFAPQNAWMLPGLWQLFVSLGLFASLHNLPRNIAWAAAFYFVSGFASLMVASQSHHLSPWLMGAPFFAGQSLLAGLLYYSTGGLHGED